MALSPGAIRKASGALLSTPSLSRTGGPCGFCLVKAIVMTRPSQKVWLQLLKKIIYHDLVDRRQIRIFRSKPPGATRFRPSGRSFVPTLLQADCFRGHAYVSIPPGLH